MTVRIYNDLNRNPTLVLVFEDPWTWDEFYEATSQAERMARARATANLVLDFRRTLSFPTSSLLHLRRLIAMMADGQGTYIIVGKRALWQVFDTIMRKMYPGSSGKLLHVESMEEARSFLGRSAEARAG